MTIQPKTKIVLLAAAFGVLLAAPAARAQTTVSTFTLNVSGTTGPTISSADGETVKFSGPLTLIATVVTDPVLPPAVVLSVKGDQITAIGSTTGASYLNECVANLTRPFGASDTVTLSFAFFRDAAGYLNARTAQLNLNLTYDTTTMALTGVSGNVTAFQKASVQPVPAAP